MSRIAYPATVDVAPEASRPLLEGVGEQLGRVPNLFRLASVSPAALEGFLGLFGALGKGRLPAATRERIALAVAAYNGCTYCLAAHTYLGTHLAKLPAEEIAANRNGRSTDPKADAAVRFAIAVAKNRGHIDVDDLGALKDAGYDDDAAVEIVAHVALNVLTNYLNEVANTEVDFPAVDTVAA